VPRVLGRLALVVVAVTAGSSPARAQAPTDLDASAPQGQALAAESALPPPTPPAPLDEAPPAAPRRHGVVIESAVGALGFAGSFGGVAPPAFHFGASLGYEPWRWLMIFAYGELALTDTSVRQGPTQKRGLPFFGFGGGLRGTVHLTERVALALEARAGALQADVPSGALANLGYPELESLGLAVGGRLLLEWYQVDPHLAFVASGGSRYGFSFRRGATDAGPPLLWEAALGLRYTF
jgi:hypothetical protein